VGWEQVLTVLIPILKAVGGVGGMGYSVLCELMENLTSKCCERKKSDWENLVSTAISFHISIMLKVKDREILSC
jgi:hypothetical protein